MWNDINDILTRCFRLVTGNSAGNYIDNPAIQFKTDVKAGRYDHLSDSEYETLLDDVEKLAKLWENQPRRPAGELLIAMLQKLFIPGECLEKIVDQLITWYDDDDLPFDEYGNPPVKDANELVTKTSAVIEAAFAPRRPAEIRDAIAARVIGQPDAVRAAAMVVHGQLAGRRSNSVFAGPSGCGKSEIWRCLSKEYPGLIRMVDFSRVSGEGWSGSMHLRDVFDGLDLDAIRRRGLIVVLDEADKILCETAVGAGGSNHNHIIQNNLLKMLDGDVVEFGAENGKQEPFSVDCQNVSVVMLGAFETLLEKKTAGRAKPIGFGELPEAEAEPPRHADISYEDLIKAGTRREIAGRINRIVALNPLDAGRYKAILEGPVMSGLQESLGCTIGMDDAAANMLSEQAEASGLGVRWMRSSLFNAIDDALFDAPEATQFRLDMRDGKLRCRAEKWHPGKAAIREPDFGLDEPVPA